jgi:two-component system cell cycle response regulator DivK
VVRGLRTRTRLASGATRRDGAFHLGNEERARKATLRERHRLWLYKKTEACLYARIPAVLRCSCDVTAEPANDERDLGLAGNVRKKVPVVEDDLDNRWIMVRLLNAAGYDVIEAEDGHQALERARAEKPDLILMDLALPRLDGWEATRRLKADAHLRHIPVLALTAFAMTGDEERAREAGCEGYITKPVRSAMIRDMVRRYVGA